MGEVTVNMHGATMQVAIGMGRWISTSWHSGKVLCIRVKVARGKISGLLEAEFQTSG